MKKSRKLAMIEALAYCVEALCRNALVDSTGPIDSALKAAPEVWDHVDKETKEILTVGLGHTDPHAGEPDYE